MTARNLAVLNGEQSFGYNLVTRALNPVSAAGATNQRNGLRRDPAVLLLQALSRAETLRSLGPRAITFSDTDGTQIALSSTPRACSRRRRRWPTTRSSATR